MFGDENPIFEFRGPWGVPIQIAPSLFLLMLVFVSFSGSPEAMMYDLAFVGMLVGSIFLHELGHAWGCLIQGIPVRRIMIFGGGGFCEHSRSTTPSESELIVAMGPIVNLVIWALASMAEPMFTGTAGWMISTLAYMNLFLALLNLLPVMPLDGGKLFQLFLMRLLPPVAATRIAGTIGLAIAVAWIPAMIFSYLTLGLVLFFIPPIGIHWQMIRAAR